jgi:uncharacterized protein (PEP-CTERM system associated)
MLTSYFNIAKTGIVLTIMSVVLVFDVTAAEWERKASLSVGETYTDNVELEENNEDSKLITIVRPTISLTGRGSRANLALTAAFEFNDLGGDTDPFNPRIRADADAELVEDFFFIDADLSSNQSTIDPFSSTGGSQLNDNDNVTTTYNYSVSPYIVRHFGQTADFQLRYTYDDQINRGDELSDSVRESVLATLQSGKDFSRISWTLTGDYQETEFDDNDSTGQDGNNEKLSGDIKLGYQLNRKLQFNGTVGKEWNNYQTFDDDDTDEKFWDVGILWEPSKRTSFDVGYGERFFSSTPRFKFSHKTRRTTFSSSYSRSLTDTRSERGNTNPFSDEEQEAIEFLEQVFNQPLFLTNNATFRDQGIFINELFNNSLALKGKRTTATLFLRESKQIREDVDEDGIFTSYGLRLERNLSSKYTLNSRLSLDERKDEAGLKSDTLRFYLSLRRKLGVRSSVTIDYSFSDRDSDRIDDDYKENRISLNFSIDL